MTTTLRPTEPLQRTDGGDLSRQYQICVNSRVVGVVRLATAPGFGPAVARIGTLRVEESDRRRGRGTVAALAAEEVARGWGCTRIEVSVPATSEHALRLAAALGYVERNRTLSKPLTAAAPLPEGSRGRPMTEAEYTPWLAAEKEGYAQTWMRLGVPEEQARAKSEDDHARHLPQGPASAGVMLRVLEHEGTPVGSLWLTRREQDVFVLDVKVEAEYRGRGHGRSLMRYAEAEAAAFSDRIALNVFIDNQPARSLYDSLGYRPVEHHLYKPLQ